MFLRSKLRRTDGKEHRSWSVVENRRVSGGRVVQRHVLYLGEINATQELAWRRSIAVMEAGTAAPRTLSLFAEDRCQGLLPDGSIVRLTLSQVRRRRPRQWGACWLALELWRGLGLDRLWAERLGPSRKGTRWDQVLVVLLTDRLLAPTGQARGLKAHEMRAADPPVQSGRHTEGTSDPAGEGSGRQARAGRPAGRPSQAAATGRRALRLRPEPRPGCQEARNTPPPDEWLWGRLKQLAGLTLAREELLMRLGAARKPARTAWRLIAIAVAADRTTLSYRLDRAKLRQARRREGRYLLRTNLTADDPARLWGLDRQLVSVEEAFRNLKGDPAIRPIFHQDQARIAAHIFIALLASCRHVTRGRRRRALAPGLTPRRAIETFAAVQMIDLHIPTSDGRELLLTRYTAPEPELALLLHKLKFVLPDQPKPKITAAPSQPSTPL